MPAFLQVDRRDGVGTVTLTHATMPPPFFAEIGSIFRELATDRGLRAVVLRSTAKAFSHGLDLKEAAAAFGEVLQGGSAGPRLALLDTIREWQRAFDAVARCPVPVVAAVHGWCIGGGLDLVSACDVRLATREARFSLRETKLAIVADVGSLQRLPRILGDGVLRELAFTGRDVDAERALRIGLVNELFDDRHALHAGADALAREIAANAPLTVRGVKRVLDHARDPEIAAGLEHVATWNAAFIASEDLLEAMQAFLERRPPAFTGR